MRPPAYHLAMPVHCGSGVVFASPHSGRDYSDSFLEQSVLDRNLIRSSEDAFVDQLFACAPDHGCAFLHASAPRAFVDLNRNNTELDSAVITGVTKSVYTPRVLSGLGVIPRVVSNSRAIYRGKLTLDEATKRLDQYWRPYHTRLQSLLSAAQASFGQAILIDCHSMPREALDGTFRAGQKRPEIIIGDRFGASASRYIVDGIQDILTQAGFTVSRNMPFAGAYITQHYGRPSQRQHAVQLEIDRSLYMDEATLRPHAGFAQLCDQLDPVVAKLADLGRACDRLAAE
jgi:N-formylglutamate amidohydrolase